MHELFVADLMTRHVITVVADTPFKELAGTMIVHDLDTLPVIDLDGRLVGIVADVDALTKLEFHVGADFPPLLAGRRCRTRWHKSSGLTAADLMTAPANTVTEDVSLTTAVRVLACGTCQIYVVDGTGHLIGTLSRHDVLKLFLRGDGAILADIEREPAGAVERTGRIIVHVTDGVVMLTGNLTLHSAVERATDIACHVPGVIAVRNHLRYHLDDLMITGF